MSEQVPSATDNPPNDPPARVLTSPGPKEWHSTMNKDLRVHMIKKIIQAISSVFPGMSKAEQMSLCGFAKKMENEIFLNARTKSEYYHLISDGIYKHQRKLKTILSRRNAQSQQSQPTPQSLTSYIQNHPLIKSQLALGVPILVFPTKALGSAPATSTSTQPQYPPIVNLDQISRTVSELVSGGQFSLNIRSMSSQQVPTSQTLPTTNNNSSAMTSPKSSSTSKEKFMKQHLVLMLHAKKCIKRDEEGENRRESKVECSLPNCAPMKHVLRHISTCELYANCTFSQCNISKELLKHWEKCNKKECSLCVPIKTELSRKDSLHTPKDQKSDNTQGDENDQCSCKNCSSDLEVPKKRRSPRLLKRKQTLDEDSLGAKDPPCKKLKSTEEAKIKQSDNLEAKLREQLECPVCLTIPNTGPIFQCNNGHLICCHCRERLVTCPVCRVPLGYSRNLTSEKLISLLSLNKNETAQQIECK